MTDAGRAFTSNLSVAEHHAIRSVGFSPVGQVMGSCVYHVDYKLRANCGYNGWVFDTFRVQAQQMLEDRRRGLPPLNTPDVNVTTAILADTLQKAAHEARMLAVHHMRLECSGLGGDGVVAVSITAEPFATGGMEYKAIGTAVRADGPVRPRKPFMSDLTGQDFAKLMMSGWVPCGLVLGVGVMIRHDDLRTEIQRRSRYHTEITGRTKLVDAARQVARQHLGADCAQHGGQGVVIRSSSLRAWGQRCRTGGQHGEDHLAEAILIGTAITRFRPGAVPPRPLQIMRLR